MATVTLNGVTVDVEAARAAVAAFDEAAKGPQFKVGDWVTDVRYGWGTIQVVENTHSSVFKTHVRVHHPVHGYGLFTPDTLRPATPAEITAATTITPKVGMLLEDTQGRTYVVVQVGTAGQGNRLHRLGGDFAVSYVKVINSDFYTVRDSVTIQGVK